MMKKVFAVMMVSLMLLGGVPGHAAAAESRLRILVNNQEISFTDAAPFIDSNSRVQVPVRYVAEALNAKVDWDKNISQVTVTRQNTVVKLTINDTNMFVNENAKTLDTAPMIKDGRTYVPIRFISEALGATVDWKPAIRTAYIDLDETKADQPNTYKVGHFDVTMTEKDTFTSNNFGGHRIIKESLLLIDESNGSIEYPSITLTMQRTKTGADMDKQHAEVRDILLQRISQGCVDEIMRYVAPAEENMIILEGIKYTDGNYYIWANASQKGPITVAVYLSE